MLVLMLHLSFSLPCGVQAVIQCHKLQTQVREKAQLCQTLRNERDKAVESLIEQGTLSLTQLKGSRECNKFFTLCTLPYFLKYSRSQSFTVEHNLCTSEIIHDQ